MEKLNLYKNSAMIEADELRQVVFNTLDFCGGAMTAVREYCEMNDHPFGQREEDMVLDCLEEYPGST